VTDARGGTDRRGTATSLPRVWASHTRGSHVRESRVCYKRIRPGLATVLVGDDPASVGYVRKKHETCATAGFYSENIHLDQAITQSQLRTEIQRGRHVVVLGRGPTLGRPLSLLLSNKGAGANAAVTVVHSGVTDIALHTRSADILIAGVGQPSIITANMVRPGAVVVSAGISWQDKRLLPDVDESVAEVAAWITPRLGGVGVTTVAMLLRNTVTLAETSVAVRD
jgi:5,10-methylene-tetrahydrofolate dehydrogenase/methenyl tetrahydrofolate cyclohydrolase